MKKSFQTEMDDTQQAVSQIVCLCTTIALHQEFGVGKTRLDRITDRIHDLEDQNTEVIMTPDANGRPSKARAEAIRESWLAGYVTSDYRIPMLRAPRGRKEQQYQIAGNKAARIAWQIYAKAVIDILHYGPERLERLRKESHANYEQLNQWAHEDGLDVAMEKLRRCAADAMQAPDLEVTDNQHDKTAQGWLPAPLILIGGNIMEAMLNFIPAPVAIVLMLAGFIALAIGGIRLGYKVTVKDLALELVNKAELSIMGSGQGAKKKKQVFAALRAKCPAAIRWAITDEVLDTVIEHAFDVMTAALGKKS